MKKHFYAIAFIFFLPFASQAQYAVVNGQFINHDGTNIAVHVSSDSSYNVVYCDSTGFFSDTVPWLPWQGTVTVSFTNCNGVTVSAQQTLAPNTPPINFTLDYCPTVNATLVTVIGQIANYADTGLMVLIATDFSQYYAPVTQTGAFVSTAYVYSTGNPITVSFEDCDGSVNSLTVMNALGTTVFYYNGLYCDTAGSNNPCGTLFSVSYDAANDAFTLTMDSGISLLANTYLWNFGDGNTSTDPYPTHTYDQTGLYNVCLYIAAPAGVTCSYCKVIGIDSAGNVHTRITGGFTIQVVPYGTTVNTTPTDFPASINVFPNPANDVISIVLHADKAATRTLRIVNAAGQIVKAATIETAAGKTTLRVPVADLPAGVYTVTLASAEETTSRVFVK